MPTPIDDLKVGMWIAVSHTEESGGDMMSPFSMFRSNRGVQIDGRPLQIQAISLPFIAVTDGVNRMPLDIRTVEVQKLDKAYVKLLRQNERRQRETQTQTHGRGQPTGIDYWVADNQPEQKEPEKRRDRCCPLCGNWLIERLINETSDWVLACRECGFTGTIPGSGEET